MSNLYLSALSVCHTLSFQQQKSNANTRRTKSNQNTQKNQTKNPNRSQEAIRSNIGHPVDSISGDREVKNGDDSMEIVVVSDTVRQRRSRTPLPQTPMQSSATESTTASELPAPPSTSTASTKPKLKPKPFILPDLLPKTFHLAESSALFSQVDNDAQNFLALKSPSLTPSPTRTPPAPPQRKSSLRRMAEQNDYENVQKVSVVEIRESNLTTPKKAINTFHTRESLQRQNLGQVMNTCSILESVDFIEPCNVETVHIVDVTSEPSDSETPSSTPKQSKRAGLNNQREASSDSDDEGGDSDESDAKEYETGEEPIIGPLPETVSTDKMRILRRGISWDESRKPLKKDRDLLRDCETQPHRKLVAGLKEILSVRSGDFDREAQSFDEPLVFSEDDDDDEVDEPQANRDTVFFHSVKKPSKTNRVQKFFLAPSLQCISFCEYE